MARCSFTITPDVYVDPPNRDMDMVAELVLDVPRYVEVNTAGVDVKALQWSDDPAAYIRDVHGAIGIVPVFAYVHSGVTIRAGGSVNPFSCPWDSGMAGFAWTTPERCASMGVDVKDAATAVRQDVETWDQYLTGDVWVLTVTDTDTGETVECLGGIYGSEDAESEARAIVQALEDYDARKASEDAARELAACASWWQD